MDMQKTLRKEARHADKYGYHDATRFTPEDRHAFALSVIRDLERKDKKEG